MFKIIKTSTYNDIKNKIEHLELNKHILKSKLEFANRDNVRLHMELHNLTAKKLPIKKSKNK